MSAHHLSNAGSRAFRIPRSALLPLVRRYAQLPLTPVSLEQFATGPPVSSRFLMRELPVRLAHRIQDFRALPYIITELNSEFQGIYQLYLWSFAKIVLGESVVLEDDKRSSLYRRSQIGVLPDLTDEICALTRSDFQAAAAAGAAAAGLPVERGVEFHARKDLDGPTVEGLLGEHAGVIGALETGYRSIRDTDLSGFMDRIITTRIGNRVLAESFKGGPGSVVRECSVREMVRCLEPQLRELCLESYQGKFEASKSPGLSGAASGSASGSGLVGVPRIVYKGNPNGSSSGCTAGGQEDDTVLFIPEHLNFILQEILKNSMRATIESHQGKRLPPIYVESVIQRESDYNGNAGFGTNANGNGNPGRFRRVNSAGESLPGATSLIIKISDRGGGIHPSEREAVWRYGYTSVQDSAGKHAKLAKRTATKSPSESPGKSSEPDKRVAGYGFGLPLARLYARYFGGEVYFQTMSGFGTDVYIHLRTL